VLWVESTHSWDFARGPRRDCDPLSVVILLRFDLDKLIVEFDCDVTICIAIRVVNEVRPDDWVLADMTLMLCDVMPMIPN